jgi:hypothetical protein
MATLFLSHKEPGANHIGRKAEIEKHNYCSGNCTKLWKKPEQIENAWKRKKKKKPTHASIN